MSEVSPGTVLRATARAVYADLVTVVVTSVLVALAALPVVTLGAALLALVETWTEVVTRRDTGAPPSERGRARLFSSAFRAYLRSGLVYSLVVWAVSGLTVVYYVLGAVRQSGVFVVAAIVGVYLSVVAVMWCLRAASFQVRSDGMSPLTAFEQAGLTVLDKPYFAVILWTVAGTIMAVGVVLRVAVPILVPGVLAILEVVAFEEIVGDGVETVRSTYRQES